MQRTSSINLNQPIGIRQIWTLAWPMTISMLSFTAMSVADTLFVGWLGTTELASIGIASIAAFATSAFGMGLLAGIKIVTAHRVGAQQQEHANRLLWQGIWMAIAMGCVGVLLSPWVPQVFGYLNPSPAIQELGGSYLQIRMLGLPIGFAVIAFTQWLQGLGDMRTPMVANVSANALNIALDPLFIFGGFGFEGLGIAGAAWATLIAWFASILGLIIWSFRTLRATPWHLDVRALQEVTRLGLPLAVQRILGVLGFLLFSIVLGWCGEAHLAAHALVLRIVSVSFLPGYAIGEAASVLVGQSLGAKKPERATEAWWMGTRLAIAVMTGCALLFITAPELWLTPFKPSPEVRLLGIQLLLIAGVFQIFDAVAMVGLSCLAGAGDTRFSMFTTITCMWLFNLPLALLLSWVMGWGAPGAWCAMTAEIFAIAVICWWRIRSGRWMKHYEGMAF